MASIKAFCSGLNLVHHVHLLDKEEHILRNDEDTNYPLQKTTFNNIITKPSKVKKYANPQSISGL